MRFSTFLLFVMLIVLSVGLGIGMYFLWLNLPAESLEFNPYHREVVAQFPTESIQFYPNMRYRDREISYFIESNCSLKKENDARRAFLRIQDATILSFSEMSLNPEIVVMCSNLEPTSAQENHFIAGEGGPVQIINSTKYAIISAGMVSLYRAESCPEPQIATHEILHALGFDHNSNIKSLMYPVTECDQILDQNIIDEINRLYSDPSLPDLVLEFVRASKSGIYLDFEAKVSNQGLVGADGSELVVIVENSEVKRINIGDLEAGMKKILEMTSLRVPRDTEKISFVVEYSGDELTKQNNRAELEIVGAS
jgi:hypothetical protein